MDVAATRGGRKGSAPIPTPPVPVARPLRASPMVFNVQRYSTHDGPGIRTVVFLKGCTLSCRWCQNPEGQSLRPELFFNPEACIPGCSLCQEHHPRHVETNDGAVVIHRAGLAADSVASLAELCPSKAISAAGEAVSIDDAFALVLRDLPFYRRSGGGLTLSGGEPFLHLEYTRSLLEKAKAEGIHTAVESCLHVPLKRISPLLPLIDLLLADVKHVDDEKFHIWTSGHASVVRENFRQLAASGIPTIARVPLIPGFNADRVSIMQIVDFVAECGGVKEIHFLAYHTLGKNKYALLGIPYQCGDTPLKDPALLGFAEAYAQQRGLKTLIGG